MVARGPATGSASCGINISARRECPVWHRARVRTAVPAVPVVLEAALLHPDPAASPVPRPNSTRSHVRRRLVSLLGSCPSLLNLVPRKGLLQLLRGCNDQAKHRTTVSVHPAVPLSHASAASAAPRAAFGTLTHGRLAAGVRRAVPNVKDVCASDINWLQKKPADIAPGYAGLPHAHTLICHA